jgi:outer membrane receptor protein involved in Fe transport
MRADSPRAVCARVLCGLGILTALSGPALGDETTGAAAASDSVLQEITITTQRLQLLGTAQSASEGVVADEELQLLPAYRPAQLLETVPGLIVTSHSGEGKANQYLMRGYNLDHGTDLETWVDGMPINEPTHAHGQGYTDLSFMIPELADRLTYTKGPYYADVGDFGAVGSIHVDYRDVIADQAAATSGTYGFQRLFTAGAQAVGDGHLLEAVEVQDYDGPFDTPDDQRKENAVLRYSAGDERDGYSLTGMVYHDIWNNTTDLPLRAVSEGLVPNRFGSLDPSDGGRAWRSSLSFNDHVFLGQGQLTSSAFFIDNQLHLWNDFTHYLIDPVHGDQEEQYENRRTFGGRSDFTVPAPLGDIRNQISVGMLVRDDILHVGRGSAEDRVLLPVADSPPSYTNDDMVYLFAAAAYLQAITHWTSTLRSVIGVREDYQHGTDADYLAALHETAGYTNGGTVHEGLIQPKGSLIYTLNDSVELYLSAGRGFHSADIRGVNQDGHADLGLPNTPLLAKQEGQEVGVRAEAGRTLAVTFAIYNLWQQSETVINPDVGEDSAGPPSRRYGAELNLTYRIDRWLELYGSISGNHTRFTHPFDDGTGHLGTYITDAPAATGSLALYLTDLGPWSGGLGYRYLGNYPLASGPCNDAAAVKDFPGVATSCANAPTAPGQVNGKGFTEVNLDVRYALSSGWSAALGLYNLLDTHAAAAEFWYVDRLQDESAAYPDGRADIHEHPLEPTMLRFTLAKVF